MSLLEKYKAMVTAPPHRANTEEREKSQKWLIKGTTSNIRNISPVADPEISNLATLPPVIVVPETTLGAIWVNPYKQGTPEARRESLGQIMSAEVDTAFQRVAVIWPDGFFSTQGIINADAEIERVQGLVLSGMAKLDDFRQAVEAWEVVCLAEISKRINK